MARTQSLTAVLRRFAAVMVDRFDVSDVLYELGDHAVAVLAASGAGVSVADENDQLRFVTSTSETVNEIEEVQQRGQAGPCVEAFTTGNIVVVSDIASLDRWDDYRDAAERCGLRAVVGLPLAVGDRRLGSLNVYDTHNRDWSPADLDDARVLADIATAYLIRAGELAEARQLTEQLQHALDARIVIEQAKGMLARDHEITVDQAFWLLRDHARRHRQPIRTIAHAVVELNLRLPPSPN